jgi:16S rRNA (adenine1518-N6/adenine1519-N6)-dimethyltransferase
LARQRFGQHFLNSPKALERIAAATCGDHIGTVVEIGPGRGALTRCLLPRADRVIAIELDPALVTYLETEFAAEPRLTIVSGDALDQDFAAFGADVICGNLPYYVATPILERVSRAGVPAVALIQKEVAERITAQPGSRDYGFLTCNVALFAQAKYLFTVKPGAFRPPPQVESAVIRLQPHPCAAELGVPEAPFLKFLSTCFQYKRKTLRNNLAGNWPREALDALPVTSQRAEQLALTDLAALYLSLVS